MQRVLGEGRAQHEMRSEVRKTAKTCQSVGCPARPSQGFRTERLSRAGRRWPLRFMGSRGLGFTTFLTNHEMVLCLHRISCYLAVMGFICSRRIVGLQCTTVNRRSSVATPAHTIAYTFAGFRCLIGYVALCLIRCANEQSET